MRAFASTSHASVCRVRDPGRDAIGSATITAAYGVAGTGARATIKDLGRPWRAFASRASTTRDGLRVRVDKVALYARAIAVVVTFANVGDGFITLLPYGRSVLRDDAGNVYRLIGERTGDRVDRRLALGVHLAADAQITGVLSFASPRLDDGARRFTLTVGPAVRDGADAPLTMDVTGISPGVNAVRLRAAQRRT